MRSLRRTWCTDGCAGVCRLELAEGRPAAARSDACTRHAGVRAPELPPHHCFLGILGFLPGNVSVSLFVCGGSDDVN